MPRTPQEAAANARAGKIRAAAAGKFPGGTAPYGYRPGGGGELIANRQEQSVAWLIGHLRGLGWSLSRIGAHLEGIGIAPRSGTSWAVATLHRIALRERDAAGHAERLTDTG